MIIPLETEKAGGEREREGAKISEVSKEATLNIHPT